MMRAAMALIGIVAQFMIWAAYILQQFLLGLAFAFILLRSEPEVSGGEST